MTNPEGTSPTLSDLKTYAVSKGYYAFSDNGNMYNTALPVKSKWLTNTEHSLYREGAHASGRVNPTQQHARTYFPQCH